MTSDADAQPRTDEAARPMLAPSPEAAAQHLCHSRNATMAPDMCPRCKGDNAEDWALCAACADATGQHDTKGAT